MDYTRETIERAMASLKVHEGFRQHPYKDTRGILTIGYGRNLEAKGISDLEAHWLLMNDATAAAKQLASLSFWTGLSPVRQAALIDLTVNLGFAGVLEFKNMLARLGSGDFIGATHELHTSLAQKQEPNRIADLVAMILAG